MNKLNTGERAKIIRALIEGMSINATCRMFGCGKPTILRLIKALGDACRKFHDENVRNLRSKRLQMDELWAFVHCKQKNVRPELEGVAGVGDTWTWTCIDADTKLMVAWHIGPRDAYSAQTFTNDVAWRLTDRVQVTTDGFHGYWSAVCNSFDCEVDFAQLVKLYGPDYSTPGKYSPPECIGIKVKPRTGNPDPKHISTSFVERSNLTVRMGVRRYTRLTNAHSKKLENHVAMTSIFFTCYNFCRVHQTIGKTPAVAAGLARETLTIEELLRRIGF